ncbi:sodium:alanine symporter family protein [Tissierella sp. MB52-C2]|uniref:alanine/glycine:cation symporter family protein n=1 Tax=Tissierella sp. MB52-C2 TaxID=3070999 RepID=UPI00280AA898|nr:sodium:alanine symporter family protein [Tissierella sp. MB52-C2]WMM24743.1 sodium:alanine symporter family protein [Tissierella sp. MB52-C2]
MQAFVNEVNVFLWENFLMYALLITGIYYTIRLGVPQISKIGPGFKQAFGGIFKKEKNANADGDADGMTSFQALATAVAAQVGTGNLAGVATAIASGGPGAIFWMWMSALFGMATNFGEAVLAQKYADRSGDEVTGGPAYYLSRGVKSKFLAGFFAVTIIIALGFVGNMVQSNSIATAVNVAFGFNKVAIGIATAIFVGLILVGGMSRIASFAELVVPFMALLYIIGSFVIIFKNPAAIGPAFKSIVQGAFTTQAAVGGALGVTMKQAVKFGIARGLFSNEAGMGSTPHAHAVAKVAHPAQQGMVAMVGVIIDTIVICTVTALINLVTGANTLGLTGIEMTQEAFRLGLGNFGTIFIAISLFFFALTTIIGWYFFGEANIKYLFGAKAVNIYKIAVLGFIILGSFMEVGIVWDLADMFNGLMVIPNLIGLLILAPQAAAIIKDYDTSFIKQQR